MHIAGKETAADRVKILLEHNHGSQYVYPTLADGVQLTTAAGDWAQGTTTEIIPASTITSDFDIHEVLIEVVNTKDKTYQLTLYYGAGDTFAGSVRFSSDTNKGGVPNGSMMTPMIPANSRVRASLAIQDGDSKTATISVRYHLY